MKTYLVGYDLNRPHQDYPELIRAIKQFPWWHYLDSTWIVKSNSKASEIRDNLAQHIDTNDELLVVSLTGESAWTGFDATASAWLHENIQPS